MKIKIKVPMRIRDYDDETDNLHDEIKFFVVVWDREKGTLEGDELPVDFLNWAIQSSIGAVDKLPYPMGEHIIKDPLRNLSDMVYVLRGHGINLPEELQMYCSTWSLNQQYYDLRESIEDGSVVF